MELFRGNTCARDLVKGGAVVSEQTCCIFLLTGYNTHYSGLLWGPFGDAVLVSSQRVLMELS